MTLYKDVHRVGTNTEFPGTYSVERVQLGPTGAFMPATGDVIEDCSAKFNNADCLYFGTPRKPIAERTNIRITRFHGHDSGRAFMSVVVGKDVICEDFVAEKVGRNVLNCEPTAGTDDIAENIVMRRGQLGRVQNFAFVSKSEMQNTHVSAKMSDLSQLKDTNCGNAVWIACAPVPETRAPWKSLEIARANLWTRGSISDGVTFWDPVTSASYTVSANAAKPIFALNAYTKFTDYWLNGKPLTEDMIKWQWTDNRGILRGVRPVIIHTPGWSPSSIVGPAMGGTTPPPPPEPVDPCASLRLDLATAQTEVGILQNQVVALTQDKTALNSELILANQQLQDARNQALALEAKIARAIEDLS